MTLRQSIDIPPVWLALAIALLWGETRVTGGGTFAAAFQWAGWALIGLGVCLMAAALAAFFRAGTTPVPHQQPEAMITTGVFGWTRNPIYLGDASVLLGAGLVMGALSVVAVLPLFVLLIDRRFIRAEEARLAAGFPAAWPDYRDRVRRWL